MRDQPTDFHRGISARAWHDIEGGPEIAYFRDVIAASGEPVLDAGCGAGRLLLPWLEDGVDVDGADVSPDMLDLCRSKAAKRGLTPRLFEQPMHALDLPRQYRTVIVCGALGLGTTQEEDAEALRRTFAHLLVGGTLAVDFETPWTDPDQWRAWTTEGRNELPIPFGSGSGTLEDGTEYRWSWTLQFVDPFDRMVLRRARYEVLRDGQVVDVEERELRERWHFPTELRVLLERAGFADVRIEAGYEHRAPTPDDRFAVMLARKPA
ncbi:MAG: class I SAM-dependent methyltransferase [Actinomycetota bacterium]